MIFAAPIWLLALAPWAVLGWWMMRRRGRVVSVPFVALWRIPRESISKRRGWRLPPWGVLLLLAASLLAILGAAGPTLGTGRGQTLPVTILVDRGMTMSAGRPLRRYQALARELQAALAQRLDAGQPVDLYFLPHRPAVRTTLGRWLDSLNTAGPTAVDTAAMLPSAVASLLAKTSGPLLLIGDRLPDISNNRLILVSPKKTPSVIGIIAMGARDGDHPQVMVGIRNQSSFKSAVLRVESAGRSHRRTIDLPPAPQDTTVFVDMPTLGGVVTARLESGAEPWAGDTAWLVRTGNGVHVSADRSVSGALGRMIEVYNRAQPASDEPAQVHIVFASEAADPAPAAILATDFSIPIKTPTASVTPGPLTAHVRWEELPITSLSRAPEGDWRPVVSIAGHPALAVSRDAPRRVWIGFDPSAWANRADYVIFWKNVFDYLGRGQVEYQSSEVQQLGAAWRKIEPSGPRGTAASDRGLLPGLYQDKDGRRLALNAPDVRIPPPLNTHWREAMDKLRLRRAGGIALRPALLMAALLCAAVALPMIPGGRPTRG